MAAIVRLTPSIATDPLGIRYFANSAGGFSAANELPRPMSCFPIG